MIRPPPRSTQSRSSAASDVYKRQRELYERPADRFLADFIGDANLITGEVVQDGTGQVFVAGSLRLPLHASNVSGPALFAVRPQRLTLHRDAPSTPSIKGTLLKTAYLGTHL